MKVTQKQVNNAYTSLAYLSKLKLPIKISYDLYKMVKIMEEKFNFSVEEEQKLLAIYDGIVDEQGVVHFKDSDSVAKFNKDHEDLLELEHELDIEPVTINMNLINDQRISIADIINLEGFVLFE